eukprot:sb/3479159/
MKNGLVVDRAELGPACPYASTQNVKRLQNRVPEPPQAESRAAGPGRAVVRGQRPYPIALILKLTFRLKWPEALILLELIKLGWYGGGKEEVKIKL